MRRPGPKAVMACLLACSTSLIANGAESPQSIESFKAVATKAAEHHRSGHAFQPGGCDVNAVLGGVIMRSREPLLQPGDRVVSVGDHVVRSTDSVFDLVNALPMAGSVRFGLVRKNVRLNVTIQCLDSREGESAIVAAFDAAAAGNFASCAQKVNDYESKFVHHSSIYGLGRRCSMDAGLMTDEQLDTTHVAYWTLRLQELKYQPESIDEVRPAYLSARDELMKAGKSSLADELRRQWALATGEKLAPAPALAPAAAVPPPRSAAGMPMPRRRFGSSCEDGHYIKAVMGDGAVIKLEDGTLWEVDSADTVDSALWLPATNIVVCDGKLINTDDNESVEAEEVH